MWNAGPGLRLRRRGWRRKAYIGFGSVASTTLNLINEDTGGLMVLTNANTNQLYLAPTGEVGIGLAAGITEKLHVSGRVIAQGFRATLDTDGAVGAITYTGASQGVSTGTGTVKMGAGTSRNSTHWVKLYIGTTAVYIPAWDNIS